MKGPRDFLNSAPMSNLQAADPLPEDRSADSYRYVSRGDALVTDPLLDHQRGQDSPLLKFTTLNLAVRRFDAKALEGVSMHAWPFVVTIGVTAPVVAQL